MKHLKKFLVACMALLIFAGVMQTEVKAAEYKFDDTPFVAIWSSDVPKPLQYWGKSLIETSNKTVKVVKITQSKKILKNIKAEVSNYESKRNIVLSFYPKKPGTTTLNITVKCNGKKKVHKLKVTVLKHENPVKTLKIGNKNYAGKFKNGAFHYISKPKKDKKVKLYIKTKKGYKIDAIYYMYMNSDGTTKTQILKNRRTFKLRTESTALLIYYRKKVEGIEQGLLGSIQVYFR